MTSLTLKCPHPGCETKFSLEGLIKAGLEVFDGLLVKEMNELKEPDTKEKEQQPEEEEEKEAEHDDEKGKEKEAQVHDQPDEDFQEKGEEAEEEEEAEEKKVEEAEEEKVEGDSDGKRPKRVGNKLTNSLKLFIESNEGYVMCPNEECGMIFEHLPPTSQEKEYMRKQRNVDDNGEPIVGEALDHYFDKRFRCRFCNTVFCSGCKTIPYHLGYTCAQFQSYKSAQVSHLSALAAPSHDRSLIF